MTNPLNSHFIVTRWAQFTCLRWGRVGCCGALGRRGELFSGRFDHSIDEKGRVSIPARFREILQRENHDRLYITNFPYENERCLALYPPSQWDTLNANLRSKPRFDPRVQAFETFFIGGAHE